MTSKWSLSETIHLLELFTKNELWDNRAMEMKKLFGAKHPPNFFTVQSCKRELHRVFSQPNPGHVNSLPTHPRSKEAAEMWMSYYNEELQNEQAKTKQLFWVGVRSILDTIQKFKIGKLDVDYLVQLRDQYRDADKDNKLINNCVDSYMEKAQVADLKNVTTTDDLLRLLRGDHVPEHSDLPATPVTSKSTSKAADKNPFDMPNQQKELANGLFKREQSSDDVAALQSQKQPQAKRSRRNATSATTPTSPVAALPKNETHLLLSKKPKNAELQESKETLLSHPLPVGRPSKKTFSETPKQLKKEIHKLTGVNKPNSNDNSENAISSPQRPYQAKRTRRSTAALTPSSASTSMSVSPRKEVQLLSSKKEKAEPQESNENPSLQSLPVGRPPKASRTFPAGTRTTSSDNTSAETSKQFNDIASEIQTTPALAELNQSSSSDSFSTTSKIQLSSQQPPLTKRSRRSMLTTPLPVTSASAAILPSSLPSTQPPPLQQQQQPRISERRAAAVAGVVSAGSITNVMGAGFGSHELVGKAPLLAVWKEICAHRDSSIFYAPVSEQVAPGYRSAVKRPMDLLTIRRQIESGAIETFSELTSAVALMFANAVMFNSTDHDVNNAAKDILQYSLRHIMDAQFPFGEFGDVVTASSFLTSSSSRRSSRGLRESTHNA